jgi:hypothetical protein
MNFGDHATVLRVQRPRPFYRRRVWSIVGAFLLIAACQTQAPAALAQSGDNLRAAVAQMRNASCPPLRSDPIVEQAARNINQSTDAWIDHTARTVPVPDPAPLLDDLGYGGRKSTMLLGAGSSEDAAIKGLLLQGYARIPDCSYTDYGADVMRNESTGYFLMTVVLAGA